MAYTHAWLDIGVGFSLYRRPKLAIQDIDQNLMIM